MKYHQNAAPKSSWHSLFYALRPFFVEDEALRPIAEALELRKKFSVEDLKWLWLNLLLII